MATPTQRVFEIPELLELILLPLSIHSLLSVQLVSRSFWHTIRSSPILQRALYLRPEPKTASYAWEPNHILIEQFRPWFTYPADRESVPSRHSIIGLPWFGSTSRREVLLRKEASWRHMLPIQPPPTKLTILRSHFSRIGDSWHAPRNEKPRDYVEIEQEGGITMGLLYDVVEGFLALLPADQFEASFGVRWILHEAHGNAGRIDVELYYKNRDSFQCQDFESRENLEFRSQADGTRYPHLGWRSCNMEAVMDRSLPLHPWEWKSDLTQAEGAILAEDSEEDCFCSKFD
ncbi:hypothetical protein BU16DRAFT_136761 [Lophium mytilinum]|uniref:F-box domain-containing protein n=1 Tax=Lophium mytilinum TaxID=390894 RepID=A0A6A6QF29_9PEZI|nr:hypothetical protein BU16DRAFT_136761 [Lophium mytilinum]